MGKATILVADDDAAIRTVLNQALTRAKAGESLPRANCDNPVASHYELGTAMEIRGTPAIVTENGKIIPGYVPAERLALILDAHTAKK